MRQVVIDRFFDWSTQFEGYVPWMYLDCKGLVTVGVGNLIDPVYAATPLPFVHADGTPATQGEISDEWHVIKGHQDLTKRGYKACQAYCKLRLTRDGVGLLVARKLAANWDWLKRNYFQDADNWPAAAQLGVSSMAWAMGPGFPRTFKNFTVAARAGDWTSASKMCAINASGNVGIIPRNKADTALFLYAADPTKDPDSLP